MRDPSRIPRVLETVRRIWERYPDLRLTQLILNVAPSGYYMEDDELVRNLAFTYQFSDEED